MAQKIEIFVKRKSYGTLPLASYQTLGHLTAALLDLTKNVVPLPAGQTGSSLIENPPTYSDWSFLLLAKQGRYLFSYSFAQIKNISNISLDSPVYRIIDDREVPDVVGPSVATERPDASFDQCTDDRKQLRRPGVLDLRKFGFELFDARSLFGDACFGALIGAQEAFCELRADLIHELREQLAGVLDLLVQCEAETEAELRAVFEQ